MKEEMITQIDTCLSFRLPFLDNNHLCAIRLYNGFLEGNPGLIVDLFGRTLVISWHGEATKDSEDWIDDMGAIYQERLPWIETILIKARQLDPDLRRGKIRYGNQLQNSIVENGIKYAIDLQLNQDNSFYLDTRNLRKWLHETMNMKTVLNTFAYTGSLGIAALAGGAARVVQTDLNERFLALAKGSVNLNKLSTSSMDIIAMDFFRVVDRFKTSQTLFDCVILDPPVFSTTAAGNVDLGREYQRLVNKVRPLVGHEGWLVLINNALYVSGRDLIAQIHALCEGPYLKFQETVPVPEDVCGFKQTIVNAPPTDPSPFNHPTKICILIVFRKDERKA